MDGVLIPILPVGVWLLATALTIVLLLVLFGYHLYFRNRVAALLEDAPDIANAAARKETLLADIDALRQWIQEQREELEHLAVEREEQERVRAELERLEQACLARDKENEDLRREVGELENQHYLKSQTLERLAREIGDLEAKREEAQVLEQQLGELRRQAEEARESARQATEHEARLSVLAAEKVSLEQHLEDLRAAAEQGRTAAEGARDAMAELTDMRRERAQIEIILDSLRGEQNALEQDIRRLEKQDAEAEEELEKLLNQVGDAREEAENAAEARKELASLRQEAEELQARKAALVREVEKLEDRIGGAAKPENPFAPYADLLEVAPQAFNKESFPGGSRQEQDEAATLQRFMDALTDNGLSFSPRVINAFHTALKCHDINPLTVLAGVSGTGKTLLPVCYARMMGMHSLIMAVQPRWDSPQDMFGFYNYLERQYKATELSRALVRMDPYNYPPESFEMLDGKWTQDRMLLVLLDEMNLARTEYYFSDFLSKLELRRLVKNPDKPEDRKDAEIELDAGPGKDFRFRLWVDRNVLFVGTMNEDETTQTLSDKVLDRANVLRFGKPADAPRHNSQGKIEIPLSDRFLSRRQWQSWHRSPAPEARWAKEVQETVTSLNTALNYIGRPFGFRVRNAFLQYVANYPRVEEEGRYKLAAADQVEQKILPKLRGIDCNEDGAVRCLNELERTINALGDDELAETFKIARDESASYGMFQWRGVTRNTE